MDRQEWYRLIRSFGYALEGIRHAFIREKNMQIHGWFAVWATLLSLWAGLDWEKYLLILFSIFWVLVLELLNTALEHVVDLVCQKPHPAAKMAKDAAAGAVLLSALFAVILGFSVLWDPLLPKVEAFRSRMLSLSFSRFAVTGMAVMWGMLLSVLIYYHKRKGRNFGLSFAVSSLLFLLFLESSAPWVQLLALFLPIAANIFFRRGWDQLAGLLEILLSAMGIFLAYQLHTLF